MKLFWENKKTLLFYSILSLLCVLSLLFVYHNAAFYDRTIAEVVSTEVIEAEDVVDMHGNKDRQSVQEIIAEIKNGQDRGKEVRLYNDYSNAGAYDHQFREGHQLFIAISQDSIGEKELTGEILDVKRDQYVVIMTWVFIFTLVIVGKKQGFYSVISLAVNAALLSFAIDIYILYPSISLVFICAIGAVFFATISLLLTNGLNEKTYAAIVATLIGTITSLAITYAVIWLTDGNGLRYEEMQFLSRPYIMIFMASLFVGSLGAVMDIAMTMSASIFEIYEKNQAISMEALRKSGMAIGKDVMGTMTNILFFVYISGSLPMLILYLKNGAPLGFTLTLNLSLEMTRALAGGIGIVLTIPIGLYTAIYFIRRKQVRM